MRSSSRTVGLQTEETDLSCLEAMLLEVSSEDGYMYPECSMKKREIAFGRGAVHPDPS